MQKWDLNVRPWHPCSVVLGIENGREMHNLEIMSWYKKKEYLFGIFVYYKWAKNKKTRNDPYVYSWVSVSTGNPWTDRHAHVHVQVLWIMKFVVFRPIKAPNGVTSGAILWSSEWPLEVLERHWLKTGAFLEAILRPMEASMGFRRTSRLGWLWLNVGPQDLHWPRSMYIKSTDN